MKFFRFFATLTIAAAMTAFVSACSDDDDANEEPQPVAESISVSPTSLAFTNGGGSSTVSVTANAAWTVDAPDWMTASPASGTSNATVTLTAASNYNADGSEDRSDTVIFALTSGEGEVTVSVTQEGNEAGAEEPKPAETISVTPTALSFDNAGEALTVTVTATGAWTVTGPEWVTIDPASADGDATVTLTADSNYNEEGSEARSDSVTFSLTSGDGDVAVSVTQAGNDPAPETIEVDVTSLEFEIAGGEKIVTVTATGAWTASGATWVTVEPASGEGDATVSVTASNNESIFSSERENTLTFALDSGAGEVTISLSQKNNGTVPTGVYFVEGFEWLDPWSDVGGSSGGQQDNPAGDTIGDNDVNAYCPQLPTPKVDGVSALQALLDRGYDFADCDSSGKVNSGTDTKYIYLQRNYLKFGKTDYHGGLYLPAIDASAATSLVLAFDWSPMETGSLKPDTVNLLVDVVNGEETTQFTVPTHNWSTGQAFEWIPASVELTDVTVTSTTKILIWQKEWATTGANRWFIDNIILYDSTVYTPAE